MTTWSKLVLDVASVRSMSSSIEFPASDAAEPSLDDIVHRARVAWPTIELPYEQFVAHLQRHIPSGAPVISALQQMQTSDLYLACACALGDKDAIAAFEHYCFCGLDTTISRYCECADQVEEVKQRVRERALVGGSRPPAIESFSGRGDLRGWVRVMAVREAIGMLRRAQRPPIRRAGCCRGADGRR